MVRTAVALELLVCLIAGCGGGAGSAPTTYDTVPRDQAEKATASTMCALLTGCGCDRNPFGSKQQCVDGAVGYYQGAYGSAEAAGLIYDPKCLATALNLFNHDIACKLQSEITSELAEQLRLPYCKVYYGTKGEGEACTRHGKAFGDDCQQGMLCLGTCRPIPDPLPVRADGEACTPGADVCEPGTYCLLPAGETEQTYCSPGPALAEQCYGTLECRDGYCNDVSKVCEPWPAIGAACAPGNIGDRRCGEDAYCDAELEQCALRPQQGESCLSAMYDLRCAPGLYCRYNDEAPYTSCEPLLPANALCGDVSGESGVDPCGDLECREGADNVERCLPEEPLVCI